MGHLWGGYKESRGNFDQILVDPQGGRMNATEQSASQNNSQEANQYAIANYYANLIIQEWNSVTGWYENFARMIITYLLLLNASATDHFFKGDKRDHLVLKQKCDSYFPDKDKRIAKTVLIRLFNGLLAILCCFIGIFFIVNDIIGKHERIIIAISILFIFYICYLMYRLICVLKSIKGEL